MTRNSRHRSAWDDSAKRLRASTASGSVNVTRPLPSRTRGKGSALARCHQQPAHTHRRIRTVAFRAGVEYACERVSGNPSTGLDVLAECVKQTLGRLQDWRPDSADWRGEIEHGLIW